ncbi:hypothetical protein [Mycobacterium avium]|uniref:hypothetical protein n=1 Tax=Mycobacterium avium TaxID=1764 RepID=UPI0007A05712|nr:hypothetical protein [Mycobacterium avium]
MSELEWNCEKPGVWSAGPYRAERQGNTKNAWKLTRGNEQLDNRLETLEDCKSFAQRFEDSLNTSAIEDYPLSGVTRIEVIDHRPTALVKGRAYVGLGAQRVELSFQDDQKTLKVFVR